MVKTVVFVKLSIYFLGLVSLFPLNFGDVRVAIYEDDLHYTTGTKLMPPSTALTFYYRANDVLQMNLILRNIKRNMHFGVFFEYMSENGMRNKRELDDFSYNNNKSEVIFPIKHYLLHKTNASIYLELCKFRTRCETKTIAQAWLVAADIPAVPYICVNSHRCYIVVDVAIRPAGINEERNNIFHKTTTLRTTKAEEQSSSEINEAVETTTTVPAGDTAKFIAGDTVKDAAGDTANATVIPGKSSQVPPSSQSSVLMYVIPSVLALCFLTPVIVIFMRRYRLRNSRPVQALYFDDSPTKQVLYAELDLVTTDNEPARRNMESPYAEVIGVLLPSNRVAK